MDRTVVELGHTEPHPLDLQQLRTDLSALWREEGKGVSRACHATLVVIVSPGEDPDALIEDLVLTHPSRVLRIEREPKLAPQDVVAWASGCCMKRSSGMLVCSETLHFRTGEAAQERLPSIVRSLAVGGVPLVIICREMSPLRLLWVDALGDDVDMIVGRSGALELEEARELWRESVERARRPRVEDLSWDELRPWRAALQSRFDQARELTRLTLLSNVKLEMGSRADSSPAAWLLAGWLGSRLGWRRPEGAGPNRIRVERTGGFTLIECGPALVTDTVTLTFEDGSEPMRWALKELPTESPSAPLSRTLHRHAMSAVAVAARKMALALAQGT
jgi:glucose-6-phosphate dehydrogenase assembly protein OpcA